jgi:hypothetical protein
MADAAYEARLHKSRAPALNINRLASLAVALWCAARIYERQGLEAALVALLALAALLSLIWFSERFAAGLRNSAAARRALNANVPPLALNLIGWILLLLFSAALYTGSHRALAAGGAFLSIAYSRSST